MIFWIIATCQASSHPLADGSAPNISLKRTSCASLVTDPVIERSGAVVVMLVTDGGGPVFCDPMSVIALIMFLLEYLRREMLVGRK